MKTESRRYGTMFGRQGQPLILDTTTKQKLALGSACTRLNEQDAEIERLKSENKALSLSDDELEAELDDIETEPISEERIREMVKFATDDDYRAVAEQNFQLRREVDRLKAALDNHPDKARLMILKRWMAGNTPDDEVRMFRVEDLFVDRFGNGIRDAIDQTARETGEATWLQPASGSPAPSDTPGPT